MPWSEQLKLRRSFIHVTQNEHMCVHVFPNQAHMGDIIQLGEHWLGKAANLSTEPYAILPFNQPSQAEQFREFHGNTGSTDVRSK